MGIGSTQDIRGIGEEGGNTRVVYGIESKDVNSIYSEYNECSLPKTHGYT